MNQQSRILVTGANGLAGSAVVEHFWDLGFRGVIPVTRRDADLRDPDETYQLFRGIRPDFVFHAAATVYGLQGNMDNQGKSMFDNTMINTSVIDASYRIATVKKIVAMGTNAVYPWPAVLPYREETIFDGRPHDGEAAYGHAKRHMLAMLEAYKASYGIDYAYLVSGNLYGPRDTFNTETGHVLPSLVKKFYDAAHGDRDGGYSYDGVNVWGDGSATRDFLYSADLARIVQLALEGDMTGPINVGSGQRCSIEYICKRLSNISGLPYDHVHYDTSKPSGRPDCFADLSKLRTLGFRPQLTVGEGLRATYDWYASKRAASPAGQIA